MPRTAVYSIVAVLIILMGSSLFLLFRIDRSPGGEPVRIIGIAREPVLGNAQFDISWPGLRGAALYVVMVVDPSDEKVATRTETAATSIPRLFDADTRGISLLGEVFELWTTAFRGDG
ncbi:MAG: hypothetical protein O7C39_09525 [Bacteroidetes bacterium]|nr:hypothetical protein [Bacteroidota bacterium]